MTVPYRAPKGARRGAGFAGDGMLGHWLITDKARKDPASFPNAWSLRSDGSPVQRASSGAAKPSPNALQVYG